jgi:hypothetical protein
MKNIYLNSGLINDIFNETKSSIKDVLNVSNNEFNLVLDSKFFKGNVDLVNYGPNITSIQVTMSFLDNTTISLESFTNSSIVFAYCNEGNFKHSFGISGEQLTLREHHSAIITTTKSVNTILHFKKNSKVQFTIIKTETVALNQSADDSLLLNLKKTFLDTQTNYFYHGIQSLKMEQMISQLINITGKEQADHDIKKEIIASLLLIEIDKNISPVLKITQAIKDSISNQMKQPRKIYRSINQYALNLQYVKIFTSKNNIFIK